MDRRDFIKIGTGGLVGSLIPTTLAYCSPDTPVFSGWIPNKTVNRRLSSRQYLSQQSDFTGSGKGKIVLLHKYLEKEIGEIIPHEQKIGDCVGQAYGVGVDILTATQIHGLNRSEKWVARASIEALYAGSRYEIGYQLYGDSSMLRGDGSIGVYCAEFLQKYGVLVRKKYGNIDLTEYSASRSRNWGRNGIPDELEPITRQHPVRSHALVSSYEDCRDAIANGYPVIFCSSVGFNLCRRHNPDGRDSQGFLYQCGTWFHSLCGIAVDDTDRPGILVINSWGSDWVQGPVRMGQPKGSFWINKRTIDEMCTGGKKYNIFDSFTISNFFGFPKQQLDYHLF